MKKANSDIIIILGDAEKGEKKAAQFKISYGISDFDTKTMYAEEEKIEAILQEIDYLPVFSKKRLLHVKNSEKLSKTDCEKLEVYFHHPPEHICIVFTGKEIKLPLKNYADDITEETGKGLFPQVFRLRRKDDRRKLVALLMEHLYLNERDFAPVITAGEIYLKNVLQNQRRTDGETVSKFNSLHRLDFELKTGKCHTGPELEIFLYYLFS
ncbi:MAG TPA: hypothetical protein PKN36_02535 [bacterium]|jgi:hypothetical protein|nr:hypothetical protein [bacterium]